MTITETEVREEVRLCGSSTDILVDYAMRQLYICHSYTLRTFKFVKKGIFTFCKCLQQAEEGVADSTKHLYSWSGLLAESIEPCSSVCPSVELSVCLPVNLSIRLSVCINTPISVIIKATDTKFGMQTTVYQT